MKRKYFLLFFILYFVLISGQARAKTLETISGFDWLQLDPDQRLDKIRDVKRELSRNKVRLKLNDEKYYDEVYAVLRRQQQYYGSDVSELMLTFASTKETGLKESIEAFQKAS